MTDLIAIQTRRPMLIYDTTETGRQRYIDAAKWALARKEYRPMTDLIREALHAARTQNEP